MLCSALSCLFSAKAYVCTAPTASPCAVAEGLSSFDVPISKLLSLPITLLLISCGERVHGERATSIALLLSIASRSQTRHIVILLLLHFAESMSTSLNPKLPIDDQILQLQATPSFFPRLRSAHTIEISQSAFLLRDIGSSNETAPMDMW